MTLSSKLSKSECLFTSSVGVRLPASLLSPTRWLSLSLGGTLRWYLNLVGREAAESPHFESVPWVPLSLIRRLFATYWCDSLSYRSRQVGNPASTLASHLPLLTTAWIWAAELYSTLPDCLTPFGLWYSHNLPPTAQQSLHSTVGAISALCFYSWDSYLFKNQTDLRHSDSFLLETINKL